ncbi:hypothetical protein [Palleronia aestuarii]|uniref:hypothetical protein n=1 Tax=Palleronia aestuarii TaxID=568105 RepID=UPI0011B59121|nr:hypothetical protein [Palleronia aestuarii]
MINTTKPSINIHPSVYGALEKIAAKQNIDVNEVIQRALIDFTWNERALDEEAYKELKMSRELIDQAVQVAQEICERDGFRSDITYEAIKVCKEDPEWIEKYRVIVGDDIYRNGNPRKGPINRQIGLRIRRATGAQPRLGSNGKPENVKVSGDIIQTYTPLVRN